MSNESIGTQLTTLCGSIIPFYLSEAETEGYPYAVYEQTVQTFRTKDGVYKYTANSYIRVYSNDFDEAQTKVSAIQAALDGYAGDQYVITHQSTSKDCSDGVWAIELLYFVIQTY